jgi:hypothetical protein
MLGNRERYEYEALESTMKFKHSQSLVWLLGVAVIALSSCANPVAETYKKGVDGGQKAIEKARDLQQTVDQTKTTIEQAKESEGSPKSP